MDNPSLISKRGRGGPNSISGYTTSIKTDIDSLGPSLENLIFKFSYGFEKLKYYKL